MTMERKISKLYKLDDASWMRHASPWSVWTRNTVLPLLVLAFWSRIWLGWWAAIPVALAVLWGIVNPHVFAAPKSFSHWASKCVLGERVWLNRDQVPVPAYHRRAPHILSTVAAIGSLFVIAGVVQLHLWMTLFGSVLIYAGKLWFLDRMVWLYEDMKEHPAYREWVRN
ncbi:DUF6653 family protein [Paenibacillus turpanensis]|uniref:DUF6653 family protein n=1 Tax=Paenibacillus turpanensis TaxID=2689078 RepID=UPI001408F267|nr:DUF6653 family protein [Paenibacillus turpanensis]